MRLVPASELRRLRTRHDDTVGHHNLPGEALLDVVPQPRVRDELGDLRSLRGDVRLPLRDRGSVVELAPSCCCVATQLAGDGARISPGATSDLTHAVALRVEDRDLRAFSERQISARGRLTQIERRHAASVVEPAAADRLRHPDPCGSLLRQQPRGDLDPEPMLHLPRNRRRTRRSHLRPRRPIRCLLPTNHPAPPSM